MSLAAVRAVGNPSSVPCRANEGHHPGLPEPAPDTERPGTEREIPRR